MVLIRGFETDDVEPYAAIQSEEWDDTMAAVRLKLESRAEIFPEGILVAEHDGEVVGCATFIRLNEYDQVLNESWEDLTDSGWCTTHDPTGKVLFGVDLSISRRAPRSAAPQMFMAVMGLAMSLRVESVVWGGRMPRYYKYADQMTPDEYLWTRTKRGRFLDPEVDLYSRIPGVEILGVVPEYFKDWESLNCGVMLRWRNPIFRFPFLRPFSDQVIGLLYRASNKKRRKRVQIGA